MKLFLKTLFTWLIVSIAGSAIIVFLLKGNDNAIGYNMLLARSLGICAPGIFIFHFLASFIYNYFDNSLTRKFITALAALIITTLSVSLFIDFLASISHESGFRLFSHMIVLPYGVPSVFTSFLFNYTGNKYDNVNTVDKQIITIKYNLLTITLCYAILEARNTVIMATHLRYYNLADIIAYIIKVVIIITSLRFIWKQGKSGWSALLLISIISLSTIAIFCYRSIFDPYKITSLGLSAYVQILFPLPLQTIILWMLLSNGIQIHCKISNNRKAITIIAAILISVSMAIVFR